MPDKKKNIEVIENNLKELQLIYETYMSGFNISEDALTSSFDFTDQAYAFVDKFTSFVNRYGKEMSSRNMPSNIKKLYNSIIEPLHSQKEQTFIHKIFLDNMIDAITGMNEDNAKERMQRVQSNYIAYSAITGETSTKNNNKVRKAQIREVEKNSELQKGLMVFLNICRNGDTDMHNMVASECFVGYLTGASKIETKKIQKQQEQEELQIKKLLEDMKFICNPSNKDMVTPFIDYYRKKDVPEFADEESKKLVENIANELLNGASPRDRSKKAQSLYDKMYESKEPNPVHIYIGNKIMELLANSKDMKEDMQELAKYRQVFLEIASREVYAKFNATIQKSQNKLINIIMDTKKNNIFESTKKLSQMNNMEMPFKRGCEQAVDSIFNPSKELMEAKGFKEKREIFIDNCLEREKAIYGTAEQLWRDNGIKLIKINNKINKANQGIEAFKQDKLVKRMTDYQIDIECQSNNIDDDKNTLLSNNRHVNNSFEFNALELALKNLEGSTLNGGKRSIRDTITYPYNDGRSLFDISNNVKINDNYITRLNEAWKAARHYVSLKERKFNRHFGLGNKRYKAAKTLRDSLFDLITKVNMYNASKELCINGKEGEKFREDLRIIEELKPTKENLENKQKRLKNAMKQSEERTKDYNRYTGDGNNIKEQNIVKNRSNLIH